ncbi:MAG TPA: phosphate ABC transporter substrate-binding protein PstS [Candidatus Kapabacteria bacterium]|jgi:phosphate transport system substrate-binding protein
MLKRLSLLSLALATSFSLLLSSCGGNKSGGSADSTAAAGAVTNITGAGGTFIYPLASKWFNEYKKPHPNIQINYQSIGSGGGIKQATEGTVDFGESDGPMNDQQLADFQAKRGCDVLHFPAAMGGVVPTYNIPGVTEDLNFTPEALAGIYLGTIKKWNDPAIATANPGVKLPNNDIVVVHRSDGSGTTYCFVDYLSKVSPEWKSKVGVGTSVNWPVGLGGKGNEGVTGQIKQTPYSIGYVELIYAKHNNISYGAVKNSSGKFVKGELAGVTAAASGAVANMPDDFRVSITNAPGDGAYPISTFTWFLIPSKISDPIKKEAIVGFLKWMLADGQSFCADLGYAPLPKEVVDKEEQAIAKIQ